MANSPDHLLYSQKDFPIKHLNKEYLLFSMHLLSRIRCKQCIENENISLLSRPPKPSQNSSSPIQANVFGQTLFLNRMEFIINQLLLLREAYLFFEG